MVGLIDEIIRILNQPADYLESITQRRQLLQKLGQLWQSLPITPPDAITQEDYVDLQIEVIAKITEILWLLWDSPLWQSAAASRSWQDFLGHYSQFVAAQIMAFWRVSDDAKSSQADPQGDYYDCGSAHPSAPITVSEIAVREIIYDLHQQLGMAFFKRGSWTGAVFGFELAWLSLATAEIFQALTAQNGTQITSLLTVAATEPSAQSQWSDQACALLCNLGAAWAMQATDTSLHQAINYYHQALTLAPNLVPAHFNLGAAYFRLERWDQAIAHLETTLSLKPDYAEACTKLGAVFLNRQQTGDVAQAIAHHETAIQLCLDAASLSGETYSIADAYYNLAVAQTQNHQPQAAIHAYEKAIFYRPQFADAHTNLSLLLLAQGEMNRGWQEYQWRWQTHHLDLPMAMDCPLWQGEDLQDKVIFLFAEQGFGDGIQFCRYVPLVAARGARVILQCQPELKRLFQGLEGVTWLVTAEEPIPAFDYYAPLMSLPQIFGTTLETVPAEVPYLKPLVHLPLQPQLDPENTTQILQNLAQCFPKPLQIGIVWSSSAKGHLDYQKFQGQKSLDLALLLEALDLSQTLVYSLQVGPEATLLEQPLTQITPKSIAEHLLTERLLPLHPYITDFADTAGLINQMDLIITIDTAVAHLAGALAKPTWVLLSYHSDWRWLGDCTGAAKAKYQNHSPWYPTMRLFRQPAPNDWHGIIQQIKEALGSFDPGEIGEISG
ncbi:MAG: tetratricopeptide repeat protein [Pseudanabaenaceae cyanobacterium]